MVNDTHWDPPPSSAAMTQPRGRAVPDLFLGSLKPLNSNADWEMNSFKTSEKMMGIEVPEFLTAQSRS